MTDQERDPAPDAGADDATEAAPVADEPEAAAPEAEPAAEPEAD